ncbi:MAG: hypothetical protein CMH36_01370 [Microbacterium sp.]|uniref:WGR domain-containing protein n=1 Tax=uncultured Microbacterium sp. TaxID=191216 RepID=UPI000C8EDC46|nr:hypothetical protein [Microbacterium sp.]
MSPAQTPTAPVVDETYLVNVTSDVNSNKFYRATLYADGTVRKNWGRVGADGQVSVSSGGRSAYDSIVTQKLGRGYSRVDVVAPEKGAASASSARLKAAASVLADGSSDPILTGLIERLVSANKHQILEASGGMISVDLAGKVTTPLGAVSAASLTRARALLGELVEAPTDRDRATLTESFLRHVPQQVPVRAGRGWASNWITQLTSAEKQYALLDALDATVRYADAAAAAQAGGSEGTVADVFRYRVRVVDPASAEFAMVTARYEDTKQSVHLSASRRIARVFALEDRRHGDEIAATAARVRNVHRYWHGTGAANVLSILARGLYVPPVKGSGIHIAGRMFGDGVYLSRSSTKSLNYSTGFWGGSRAGSTFMFLTETAMGNEYRPGAQYSPRIPALARSSKDARGQSYDSINVKPGTGGVRNHEAIVWDPMQVKLAFLVEFD